MKGIIAEFEKNPPTGYTQANGLASSITSSHVPDLRPNQDVIEAEESTILREDHGCMIVDSMGKYSKYHVKSGRMPAYFVRRVRGSR